MDWSLETDPMFAFGDHSFESRHSALGPTPVVGCQIRDCLR
jgi:hypothetical protein